MARGRSNRTRVPRPLVPTPIASFLIIAFVALGASVTNLSNLSLAGPQLEFDFPLPILGRASATMIITGQAESMGLTLGDVLPLSRDFQRDPDLSGTLDGPLPLRWSSPSNDQYQGWGRTEAYQATYRRDGLSANAGAPVEVYSRIDLFRDYNGAKQAFEETSNQRKQGASPVGGAAVGDASTVLSVANGPFVQYLVLFQKGTSLAQILVTGYADSLSADTAVSLANSVSKRMDILSPQ